MWTGNIKHELSVLGLEYVFDSDLPIQIAYKTIEQRLLDINRQDVLSRIRNSSKGYLYQHLTDNFCIQYYLCKPIEAKYKRIITCFRLSAHNLNIEIGRRNNIGRRSRLCTMCNVGDVEDEFHFILKCPFYKELREKYIKVFYYRIPSVFKLTKLLSVNNVKELCNLGKYLYFATRKRKNSNN